MGDHPDLQVCFAAVLCAMTTLRAAKMLDRGPGIA
jgi:hypothetical protein